MVFPVSRLGQRIGSRALILPASFASPARTEGQHAKGPKTPPEGAGDFPERRSPELGDDEDLPSDPRRDDIPPIDDGGDARSEEPGQIVPDPSND